MGVWIMAITEQSHGNLHLQDSAYFKKRILWGNSDVIVWVFFPSVNLNGENLLDKIGIYAAAWICIQVNRDPGLCTEQSHVLSEMGLEIKVEG